MTWAIVLWTGAMITALVVRTAALGEPASCASDFGANSNFLTRQECIDGSRVIGIGGGVILMGVIWFLGLAVLGAVWWTTRPLWRHGHGARLRRLPGIVAPPPIAPRAMRADGDPS